MEVTSASPTVFVGRARELGTLRALVSGSGPRVGLLRGEPGIGKTALLDRLAAESTGLVLRAAGTEAETHLPFGVLADLLAPVHGHLAALPEAQREALEICLALRSGQASNPLAVCAGVLTLLERAVDGGPLLVLVDDLPWVDPPSAQVLSFVCRRLRSERVTVVAAAREGATTVLERQDVMVVPVADLTRAEGRALLTTLSPALTPSTVEHLVTSLGGHPLALAESVARAGDDPTVPPRLGPTLEATWAAVLADLPAGTRTAVAVLAAAGPDDRSGIGPALRSLGLSPDELDAAERAGLVRRDDLRADLRHPLLRQVVLDADPATARRAHRALAAHGEGDRRAWHLAGGAHGPDDDAASSLVVSAVRAAERGGHGSAAHAWARAAELTALAPARAERFAAAASESLLAGELHETRRHAEAALALRADPVFAADVEIVRSRAGMWLGDPQRSVADLVAAAERVTPADRSRAAALYAEAISPAAMTGRVQEMVDLVRAARHVAGDDPAAHRSWRAAEAHALALAGDVPAAVALLGELAAEDASGTLADLQDRASVGQARIFVEHHAEARIALDRLVADARTGGVAWALAFALAARADLDTRRGRWAAARADAHEAAGWAEECGLGGTLGYALVGGARLDALRGDGAAARTATRRVLVEIAPRGVDSLRVHLHAVDGLVALVDGDAAAAVEHLDLARRLADDAGLAAPDVVPFGADLVEALLRAGQRDRAEETLDRWEDQVARSGLAHPAAAAARCRGLMTRDPDGSDAWFARALDAHDRCVMPFERARTLLAQAGTRRRHRRPGAARPLLREAHGVFAALGARPWTARAEVELAATGGAPGPRDVARAPRWAELTPQEFQVARVVAEGRTNDEAAAALFVTRKTVENHLTRVYRKLGLRSRSQLTRIFPSG